MNNVQHLSTVKNKNYICERHILIPQWLASSPDYSREHWGRLLECAERIARGCGWQAWDTELNEYSNHLIPYDHLVLEVLLTRNRTADALESLCK